MKVQQCSRRLSSDHNASQCTKIPQGKGGFQKGKMKGKGKGKKGGDNVPAEWLMSLSVPWKGWGNPYYG